MQDLRPTRNGATLQMGPFADPPTAQEQQAMILFGATALIKGWIVAHVRDDTARTVRMIATEVNRG